MLNRQSLIKHLEEFVYTVEIDDVSRPLFYEFELVRV